MRHAITITTRYDTKTKTIRTKTKKASGQSVKSFLCLRIDYKQVLTNKKDTTINITTLEMNINIINKQQQQQQQQQQQ